MQTICLSVCLSVSPSVCLSLCLSVCSQMLVVLSSTLYRARRRLSEGQESRNFQVDVCGFGCYRPKEHCCPSGPLSLSFVSTCLQCYLLCRRSVFTFLLVAYVAICCQSRLCTHVSRFLSLVSAFVSQLDGLLSSFLCPIIFLWLQLASAISQGCVHTFFLLSELGIRLRLTVELSFVAYSSSTHFLVSTFALDGLVFDFDIIQVH